MLIVVYFGLSIYHTIQSCGSEGRAARGLADNIKKLREDKGLRQKEVANALDIGYSNYNKIENGNREISVKELQRLAQFYNITVDQVINLDDDLPKEVIIEDKQAQEQLRLIAVLDKDARAIIFKMIDKMLTSKKFKDFFQKNVASL